MSDDNVTNDDKKVKAAKPVAKKKKPPQSGVNVQELARTDTFLQELAVTGEFVDKLVLTWAIAEGYDVKTLKSARGGGYAIKHNVKVTK